MIDFAEDGFKLRDYQAELKFQIEDAWSHGAQDVMPVLPCGGGKTPIFTTLMRETKGPSVAIAHRQHLVGQMSLSLARNGVRHRVIGPESVQRACILWHMVKFGRHFVDPGAPAAVAGIDSLIRLDPKHHWFREVKRVFTDEGHHLLRENKWGRGRGMFPNAVGAAFTATAMRPDGKGLGREYDGLIDVLLEVIGARELIRRGFLADYKIYAPPNSIDLSEVSISAGGDFSPDGTRKAVHRAHITGDVVQTYLQHARGLLGATFAVDVAAAMEFCEAYRAAGVTAELITAETPDSLRMSAFQRFERRQVHQLVCVDILGEGTDVPAMECISMARPTASWVTYCQQFYRPMRPYEEKIAMIFDHAGNVARFAKTRGLPDTPQKYTLERRDKQSRAKPTDVLPVKTCAACTAVYDAALICCPYCDHKVEPVSRSAPHFVDGDLHELDPAVLQRMRGDIEAIDELPDTSWMTEPMKAGAMGNYRKRRAAQRELRETISLWGGWRTVEGDSIRVMQRRFALQFGVDVMTAQALGVPEARALRERILLTTPSITGMVSNLGE